MDALTFWFIAVCVIVIAAVCLVGWSCQQLENYINNNILNKD